MKVQLLVSEWCANCHQAERVWREVAAQRAFDFEVLDMAQPEARTLVSRLRLKSVPAVVIDGALQAVGVQTLQQVSALVAAAPPKTEDAVQHAGLSLAASSRAYVLSAVAYLVLAGAATAYFGGLFASGPARPAPLHLFTLGFMVFMIYGLGEHMLSRFTGRALRMGAFTWVQFGLAHAGVLGLVTGLAMQRQALALGGGVLAWSALALFLVRIAPLLIGESAGHSP